MSLRDTRETEMLQRGCSVPHNKTSTPSRKKTSLQPLKPKTNVNLWEIKPPDFSYKLYTSLRFPEKPSRTIKEESRRKTSNFSEIMFHLPSIRNPPKKAVSPKFITTFPCLDSHKAKLMFVKSGKYPRGVYLNPKPHDFRQYQPDLPNFVTTHERDPFGLKFKSQLLNTVHGSQFLKDDKQKNTGERFITYKPRECTWDSKLILAKAPWPIKSASYTRHRRRRDVYSAFMDRVEEKFMKTCKSRFWYPEEKWEEQRQKSQLMDRDNIGLSEISSECSFSVQSLMRASMNFGNVLDSREICNVPEAQESSKT